MPDQKAQDVSEALAALSRVAPEAIDRLMLLVTRELKRIQLFALSDLDSTAHGFLARARRVARDPP